MTEKNLITLSALKISTAVLLSLVSFSCGKSKDDKAAGPVIETAPVVDQGTTTVEAPKTEASVTSADPTKSDGFQKAPTRRQGRTENSNVDEDSDFQTAPTRDQVDSDQPQNSNRPAHSDSGSYSPNAGIDYSVKDVEKTGGKASDSLSYTSAGEDHLMSIFKQIAAGLKNAEQTKMNANLAKYIVQAQLIKTSGSEKYIDLTISEGAGLRTYRLKTNPESNRERLTLVQGQGVLEFQGGFLKCIDADGGCDNAYAKVKISGAYARIIFRSSYMNQTFVMYQNPTGVVSEDFFKVRSYADNKVNASSSVEKLTSTKAASFEVFNGKSEMKLLMNTADLNGIALSVPMVVGATGSEVRATAQKLSDVSKMNSLSNGGLRSLDLTTAISNATLVKNKGQGKFQVEFDFSKKSDPSKIFVNFSRVQKQTMSADAVLKFESTIPFF